MKRAALILNRGAGSRGADAAEIERTVRGALENSGIALIRRTVDAAAIGAACAEVTGLKPDLVIAGGGDGTVSTVAAHLAGTEMVLGVLPLGTLNHFSRDVGVPPEWRDAIPTLVTGRTVSVDVGEVNGGVFINNCSLGAYPEAVRRRDVLRRQRGWGKWPAMTLAALAVFWRLRRLRLRGVVPAHPDRLFRTPFVVISNNRYGGHVFRPSMRERLDGGELWVYTTRVLGRLGVLRLAWQTVVRRIDLTETLENWPATAVTIRSDRSARIPLAVDGEVRAPVPEVVLRIRPRALRVLVHDAPSP